jgi:hypothetical protein
MTNDTKDRALRLLEEEDREAARDQERRDQEHHESRLEEARRRIKEDDAKAVAERSRREAATEAAEIARERYDLEDCIEIEGATLNRSLSELQSLHKRQGDALRRAGRPLGHGHGFTDLITPWWRDRFGGFNSLTGTPSPHFNSEGLPLLERDPLASPRL